MGIYRVEYKDVVCTKVDWGYNIFEMLYMGHLFKYSPKEYVRGESDEKTIRVVIDMFIKDFPMLCAKNICRVIDIFESRVGRAYDYMEDCKTSKEAAAYRAEAERYREYGEMLRSLHLADEE